jgi:hypothetical protein
MTLLMTPKTMKRLRTKMKRRKRKKTSLSQTFLTTNAKT